ncbi:MAG: DNA-binding protein [Clostridiales bacterium]|nr:DNA-binding protein [Clostridiales bacterium]
MEYFEGKRFGKVYTIRINPGEDFLEEVEKFIEKSGVKYGAVVSGIATFSNCVLHMVTTTSYPPVEHFERMENKALELSAASGTIADGKPHIHLVVSDEKYAYSGHCERGCTVLYLCELVIAEIIDGNFKRHPDEHGVNQLVSIDGKEGV